MTNKAQQAVLLKYARPVFHMRSQLARSRLMPMLGAGVGNGLGLPGWIELIERLAAHSSVRGEALQVSRGSNTSRTQMLYQHFRTRAEKELQPQVPEAAARERIHRFNWNRIVRECLYRQKTCPAEHPYLSALVPLVLKSPLTVNYNFDDCLEELIDRSRQDSAATDDEGYETVWEPVAQYRRDHGVIYHPNGFLPNDITRNASAWFVFAEDSYADQLIDAQRGHYSTLQSHLFRHTGLLIGLSLDDPTLRHQLRQSEKANPGHVHYYVAYRGSDDASCPERDCAVRDSNFETYGLVTLFLTGEEIAALAQLLTMPSEEFEWMVQELGLPDRYTYFLSGAVGAGKTSALAYFKSLTTFDEWLEQKPLALLKSTDALTECERELADRWIDGQFRKKNFMVSRAKNVVSIVDRSPIDPIAFADDGVRRAAELGALYDKGVAPGMVLFLRGAAPVMHIRTMHRHKRSTPQYIDALQGRFDALWGTATRLGSPVEVIDTIDLSLHEVVKAIARAAYLGQYRPTRFAEILLQKASTKT